MLSAQVRGSGPLLVYASARPAAVEVAGWGQRPFQHDPASGALAFDLPALGAAQKHVLLRFTVGDS